MLLAFASDSLCEALYQGFLLIKQGNLPFIKSRIDVRRYHHHEEDQTYSESGTLPVSRPHTFA